jgi:hypothetical protein
MSLRFMVSGMLAVAVAAFATACGSSSSSNSAAPTTDKARFLASAATKSTGTPSMKTDLTVTLLSSKLPGGQAEMTASGALDNEKHLMDVHLDMSQFVAQLGGAGSLGSPSDWVGEEIGDFGDGRAVLYMSLPFLTRYLPGGKPWIKMDLNAIGQKAGIDLSQFTQFANDPSRMVDWLRTAGGDVTTIGTEEVGGVQTTHYRATVDLDKYVDLVPADQRDAMRKAIDQLKKETHLSTFPIHVWVDNDGLVRQVRTVLTETIQGETLNVVTSEEFHDFGAPVSISLPTAGQVTDISSLTGG